MTWKYLLLLCCFTACEQSGKDTNVNSVTDTVNQPSTETVSETRTTVQSAPIASFSKPVKDELNDWRFAVSLYETRKTFAYLVRMQYKELRIADSIGFPNLGFAPKIELRPGTETYSCTIGFLDKKGRFMPYKQVVVQNDKLRFKTLATYYLSKTIKTVP